VEGGRSGSKFFLVFGGKGEDLDKKFIISDLDP